MALFLLFAASLFLLPITADAAIISKPANNLGLVGYWSFDEGSGTRAEDFSGSGKHGTFQSSPTWITGKRNRALDFNGSSDFISTPVIVDPSAGDLSAFMWVKLDAAAGVDQQILQQEDGSGTGRSWLYRENSSNKLATFLGATSLTSNAAIFSTTGTWYHVGFVVSGTTVTLYVNGAADNSATRTIESATGGMRIGKHKSSEQYWNGPIDEVRMYSRALSASEVLRLYNAGAAQISKARTSVESGLVGWWTFDGPDMVSNVADKSGVGNHGFLSGQTSTSTAFGVTGQALDFDGSDDYVGAPSPSISGGRMSASVWVYARSRPQWATVVKNWPNGTPANQFHLGLEDTDGDLSIYVQESDSTVIGPVREGAGTPFPLNSWQFVTFVADGSNVSLYRNGEEVGTAAAYDGTLDAGGAYTGIAVKVDNAGAAAGTPGYWDGLIDDVRVYNRALSASEITQIYNEGAGDKISTNTAGGRLNDGLVGYWSFNGPQMVSNVADGSGQGNHGYLVGQTSTSTTFGKVGQALQFDGVDDYVEVTDSASLRPSPDLTISVWAKTANSEDRFRRLVTKVKTENATQVWSLTIPTDAISADTLHFRAADLSSSGVVNGSTNIVDNTWHHLVATKSGSTITLYVDGVQDGQETRTGSFSYTSEDLNIGTFDAGLLTQGWEGSIDEVRIYNRALSAAEVLQLYNAGK